MRYKIEDLFPTYILTLDLTDQISEDDISGMTGYIDGMISDNKNLLTNELAPKYQSDSTLFREGQPDIFSKKLKNFFLEGCALYLKNVQNYVNRQDSIAITHVNSWFYCSWPEIHNNFNPWHDHNPAFLSGIFYIRNKGNPVSTGTEFCDPRKPWSQQPVMQSTLGVEKHFVIFPGWLCHRPMHDPSNEERRYVLACNSYAAVL
jgi:hypothetical protein